MLKRRIKATLLCLFISGQVFAQNGYVNPTPQEFQVSKPGAISTTNGFKVKDVNDTFGDVLSKLILNKKGVSLTVDFGAKIAAKYDVPPFSGGYVLQSSDKGIVIAGYDEQGAFYGLQTLMQLEDNGTLPYVTIKDFPDMPYRGVVEGFYGTPWTHDARISLLDFYGKFKMNTYLYGPKDDPYHSSPNWREPYPEKDAQNIHELVQAAKRNRVDFVWAIHPGVDIKWTEEDYHKLRQKFESMYDLGVRSFAIFFDDISGIGTNPVKQSELLNRLHNEFVTVKKDVKPLIMCPTDYTKLWADPKPNSYLAILGKTLDPSIHIMWTGDYVCGDITTETLAWVGSRIERPAFIWWNYPVTDYVRHLVLQGPVYGLDSTATDQTMAGFVSNPMEHGQASKLALYGVADYAWNIAGYRPFVNWEHGLAELMPQAKDAYRTFAIHSCDTETGYRRDESWETEIFTVDSYTQPQYDALMAEFVKIEKAPATIEAKCENRALVAELKPWLVEFEKLGIRGQQALKLIKMLENKEYNAFWKLYNSSRMTTEQIATYNEHKSGTLKLQPFVDNAIDALSNRYYAALSGQPLPVRAAIGTFKSLPTTQSKQMFDDNITTFYTSGEPQKAGSWLGLDLGEVVGVKTVIIRQGRNTPDDVDYFDDAVLEYSLDGVQWNTLQDSIIKQYDINYSSETPVDARYVRLMRSDSSKRVNWMAVRSFEVNPAKRSANFYSNISRLASHRVSTANGKITAAPVLEVVNVEPNQYFGFELPYVASISGVEAELGSKTLKAEYSLDGLAWSDTPTTARFVRYFNHTAKAVPVKMNKLEVALTSSSDEGLVTIFDKDLATFYTPTAAFTVAIPVGAKTCTILFGSGSGKSVVNQLSADGQIVSASSVVTPLYQFEVAAGSTQIEISGDAPIYEVIYKK